MRLPDGWTSFRLGDYVGTASGGTPSRKRLDYFNGSIPWVKAGELPDGIIHECGEFLSPDGLENSSAKVFSKGTLLIALYGATVGKLGFLTFDAATNQAVCAILPPEGIASRYLFYLLLHRRRELARAGQGGAQPNISQEIVREIEIPLPPIDEQERIVAKIDELFSELDAGVASLKRAKALLKKYRQAVLKAAVTGELTRDWRERHQGEIRESGTELLQRILKGRRAAWEAAELKKLRAKGQRPKDNRWKQKYKEPQPPDTAGMPPLPEGWVWATVQALCQAERPISYGVLQPGDNVSNGVPLVRVGDISDGHIAIAELKRIMSAIAEEYRRTTLRGGEVLLTVVGSIGRTAVVPPSLAGANIARAIAMLPVSPLIRASWVEVWLRFEPNRQRLESLAHEVARKTLNLEDVRDFAVPVPPFDEQNQIIEQVEGGESLVDVLLTSTNTIASQASSLRQAILKAAFAGKLVPQDPNDEPASVLLERIRAERAAKPKPARGRRMKATINRQMELLS